MKKASPQGRLIVLEGSDGSGKATQSRLLLNRLRKEGLPAERLAFPQYHRSFFSRMVAQYLRGELGASNAVHPRLAAVLYAGDRWEAALKLRARLAEGKIVVCDRYVDSNKAHQAARLPAGQNRGAFLRWIDRLEYDVFRIPRADFTCFLHVPHRVATQLIDRKRARAYLQGGKRDAHEADPHHLRRAERIYLDLARRRTKSKGALIECVAGGRLLSRTEINDLVWAAISRRRLLGRKKRADSSKR